MASNNLRAFTLHKQVRRTTRVRALCLLLLHATVCDVVGAGDKGLAKQLSQQAKAILHQAEQLHSAAASALSARQNEHLLDSNTVDMHGLR